MYMEKEKKGEILPENESEQIIINIDNSAEKPIAKNSLALGPAIVIGALLIACAILLSQKGVSINSNKKTSMEKLLTNDLKISPGKIQECVSSKKYTDRVNQNIESLKKATSHLPPEQGIGTPHSVLVSKDGTLVEVQGARPYKYVKSVIDQMLAGEIKSQTEINIDPVSPTDHYFGSKDAEIVIIEYSDLECPYCAVFHQIVHKIVGEYNGKVAWVYRHFPLESIHPNAMSKALTSECVSELGGGDTAFWKYVDLNFKDKLPKKQSFDSIKGESTPSDEIDTEQLAEYLN